MQYPIVNVHINSSNNASTLWKNLVNIGTVTLEFKRAKIENFPRLGHNLMIVLNSAHWNSEIDCNIAISILLC